MTSYIDVTPTWSQILSTLLYVHEEGTAEGRRFAFEELQRMATLADEHVRAVRERDHA